MKDIEFCVCGFFPSNKTIYIVTFKSVYSIYAVMTLFIKNLNMLLKGGNEICSLQFDKNLFKFNACLSNQNHYSKSLFLPIVLQTSCLNESHVFMLQRKNYSDTIVLFLDDHHPLV